MGDYWQQSAIGRALAATVAAAMLLLGLGSVSGMTAAANAAPLPAPAPDPATFISTWNTSNTSSLSTNTRQVKLPLVSNGTYNFTVDWGDNTSDTITSWNAPAATHTYEAAGTYTIRITGTIRGFRFNNTGDRWKITEISSWGPLQFGTGGNYFYGAKNLVVTDPTAPNLTGVTNLSAAFYGATALTGDFSAWDTSGVATLASMFRAAPNFTSDLSGWDVSNVRSLSGTFYGATSFDSDLSAWDVGAVTNMSNTFRGATSFSSSLADWDTGNVTLMGSMFQGATSFNGSVANWDISNVTTLNATFRGATQFNQSLAGWTPASVEDATNMLVGTAFDTDNYDALLESWGAADVQPTVTFDAGSALYTAGAPADGRAVLTGQYDWTITDGGERNVPDAPEEVSATGDDGEALVQWTAPADNNSTITEYTVTGTPGGTCTATPPATSCTVSSLENGTSYRFQVTATNEVGTSAPSAQSNAVTPQVRQPGTPPKPHAVPRNNAATVTVEPGNTGGVPDSYTVTSNPGNFQCTVTVPADSCQVGGLTNGTLYTFTATATNNGGTSAASPASDPVVPNPAAVMRWDTTETTSGSSNNRQVTLPLVSDGTYNFTVDWGDGSTSTITSYNQPAVTHTYAESGEYTTTITGSLRGFRFNNTGDRAKLLDVESWGPIALGTPTAGKGHYFEGATNLQISATDAPDLTNTPDLSYTFSNADALTSSLNSWDVSGVTDMEGMFSGADEFNGDITDWDTGNVTNMYAMFTSAMKFNQPIGDWDTGNVTNMAWMFRMGIFNQNINSWDVSKVTNMNWMFLHCQQYNQPLNDWDTSSVTNMHKMFEGAWVFNQPLNNWDTSNVTDMQGMFWNTRAFNQDLSAWDVSKVRNFYQMFSGARVFQGDVSTWDITTDPTKTVTMAGMFQNTPYDPDLSAWDTSRVTDMSYMFQGNTAFDGGISGWDTSNVSQMVSMFSGATAFDESLADWDITALDDATTMLNSSGFGTANYNQTLLSWARQAPPDVTFGANPTKYSTGEPASARAELVRNGWTITDGGSTNQNVPGVPGNVTSSRAGNTATVSWTASTPNNSAVTGYFVTAWDLGTSPATVTDLGCSTNGALTCDVTGLLDGTTYGFTVYAENAIGDSPSSPLETPGTPAAPIAVPGFESAYVGGYNVAAPGGAPSSYTITASPGGNTCTITVPATSCQVEDLTNGTEYTFTAQAHNDLGDSGVSAPSNAVTPAETFNSTWNTYYRSSGSTGSKQIKLPLTPTGTYNFTVYWGDGTSSEITSPTDVDATHTYPVAGIYNVAIQGSVRGWRFNNTGDRKKLFDITRWGGVRLDSPAAGENRYDNAYFAGASYLQITAEDAPDLSATTSLESAFNGAARLNTSIDQWDVSNITTMESMFANADAYNQSMNGWDTGNVTTMREMFSGADEFNGDITDWDTSAVTDMYGMFTSAVKFNQPIGDWDTGNVTNMAWMFRMGIFNQNINSWDVSKVTNMNWMFLHCQQYNQPLNDWDTSSVTNLHKMFEGAWAFNQPLSNWDTSDVTDMTGLFWNTRAFNQDLSAWNFGRVTSMSLFLDGARAFTTGNYNKLLISLANQSTRSGVTLNAVYAPGIKYSTGAPATARATMVSRSWTITDGGSTSANVPSMVTDVTWDDSGETRAVSWTAPDANGSPITGYQVRAYDVGVSPVVEMPTGCTAPGDTTTCTVTGLDDNGIYSFSIVATNAIGDSEPTTFLPPAIPAGVAVAPRFGGVWARVTPGSGGGTADSYEFTAYDPSNQAAGTCSVDAPDRSCVIGGLTDGVEYYVRAVAVNWLPNGRSAESGASAVVVPVDGFASTWDTNQTSSGSSGVKQITLPLVADGTYDFTVNWGDGTSDRITAYNQPATTHTYDEAGVYDLTITGTITGWRFNNTGDRLKIKDISHWGPLRLGNAGGYFHGAANMTVTADDALDLTGTTNMSSAFLLATEFNADTSEWDVSGVTNMYRMFEEACAFNGDVSGWDTSNVTNMANLFKGWACRPSFTGDLSQWDTSNVTTMNGMFVNSPFNGDISKWNTSKVTDMAGMFYFARNFNQPINTTVDPETGDTYWDISNVTDISVMFSSAQSFDQDLSNWDTSQVTNMRAIFERSAFTHDISMWDVSKSTSFSILFREMTGDWSDSNSPSWSIGLYSRMLIEWAKQSVRTGTQQNPVYFTMCGTGSGDHGGCSGSQVKYSSEAAAARQTLVNKGWVFSDGGRVSIDAPTNLNVARGDTTATVSWDAPAGSIGSYLVVTYDTTSGREVRVPGKTCTATSPTRTCTVTGLTPGTSYRFTVSARNGSDWGAPSEFAPYATPAVPAKPTAVAGDGTAAVSVTGGADGGPVQGYTVTAVQDNTRTCSITPPADSCEVTGLSNGTAYTFTATATNNGGSSAPSAASDPVTPLAPALNPTFGDVAPTADGFTVPITNYDPAFTWGTESSVPAAIVVDDQGTEDTADDTAEVVVTGAEPAGYVQVNVTTDRFGYADGSSMVDGTALEAARTPSFGSSVATADGFTAPITNYSAAWTWAATATYDEGNENAAAAIVIDDQNTEPTGDDTAELVVSGVPPATEADAVVTTERTDYADGQNTLTATSLAAALDPEFGTPEATPHGFAVDITNYDPAFEWAATATFEGQSGRQAGAALIEVDNRSTQDTSDDTARLVVSGVPDDTEAVAEVTTTREGYVDGSAQVSATSLLPSRDAQFGPVQRSADGFATVITNWNPDWEWSATAVSVIPPDEFPASARIDVDDQQNGDPADDVATLIVSGVPAGELGRARVTSTRSGYSPGAAEVDGTALNEALVPELGPVSPEADGFSAVVQNYDSNWEWAATADFEGESGQEPAAAQIFVDQRGTEDTTDDVVRLIVTGVPADTNARAVITTTRSGYADGELTANGTSLMAALRPTIGATTPTADGFTAPITNYDADYTWTASALYENGGPQEATAEVVVDGETVTLEVSGVPANTDVEAEVRTTRDGYAIGSRTAQATSLRRALTPTLGSATRTATGYTVQVNNYDDAYTWNATANAGSAAIDGTGLVTVSGLTPSQLASVTVTTQRSGYAEGTASTSARALNAALTPAFGSPTPTANGFTVQITNYDGAYNWSGTATAGGSVAINGTGLVTVTGVAADTSSTATISTTRSGYVDGSAQVSARSLKAALNPTYNTSVRTADGFTAQIRSYNNLYTYNATTNAGSVSLSPTGLITVTGLSAGQLATVTVTTARSGFAPGSSTIAQRALFASLTPAFGTPNSTATGYTVQITNYSANYTWAGSATAGGSVSISGTGLVTVSGLNPGTSATSTVTAARSGYVTGTANVNGTSTTGAALTPSFSDLTRTSAGFNARIDNYDAAYTWNATATVGTAAISDGRVVVSGLSADTESVVTVTTARTGYSGGSAALTGKSLRTGLTPTLGTPSQTSDGYTVQVSNYDGNYTWTTNPTAGSAAINGSGLVTVSGLSAATSSTVTVTARRSGFTTGSAEATASSLATANTPQFGEVTRTNNGFTAPISNYDAQFAYGATTSLGSVSVSGSTVTVTGLNPGASATATVTTTRSGYASGSNTVTGQALQGAPAAEFGTVTRTNDGFVVPISNYDSDFTWTPSTSVGSVSMNGVGVVTVSGLSVGQSATLTVVTSRSGFESASAEITRSSLSAALTPLFAAPSGTVDGFTVDVTNYDNTFSWQVTTSAGSASINGSGRVTVTGLGVDTPATVTVSTTKTGHRDGGAQASGRSLQTGLTPTYRTTTRTADGFTVPVRNYDAAYQWSVSTDVGSASISNTGVITVTGVPAGALATITTSTQRTGYTRGESTVAQRALYAARTPTFGTPTRTPNGYTVQITNYSTLFTWTPTATAGSVTVSNTGLVTVTGLTTPGESSTVTVTSRRSGYADGQASVTSSSEVG